MANIRLKLTALSPIHIGSSEVYEPTNFIMDEGILYSFRDEDFYINLPDIKKEAFMRILNENKSDSFVRIHKFVKDNKNLVKEIATGMVSVTDGLQKDYDKLLGQVRQFEGKGRTTERVFNKFEIQRIQRKQVKTEAGTYANTGYIVGSSLKGSISTAYQELVYKKEGFKAVEQKFQAKGREISNNLFKAFKVSDSIVKKVNTKVGFALNKERFEYDFHNPNANVKLSTYIEVIEAGGEFTVDINHGSLDIEEILESCNSHYMPIFRSLFLDKVNGKSEYINKYLSSNFYESYRHFQLKPNQYLLRVGKHSGARSVTIDGLREIKSKLSGGGKHRKPNKFEYREDETTTWLFGENSSSNNGLLPFGWVLAEISEEKESGAEAIDGLYALQVQRIKERVEKNLAIEEKLKEEEEEKAQRELQEKERLASMTPVQRLIDAYNDLSVLINEMKDEKLENFEEIKLELAGEVKKELQKTPKTWDKAKKKALDRKNYIEGLLK
ncbi:MAG: Putative CRISPR-associated RAMP protein, Csm5 family [uncultured Sulfurovum sp.]|uniref:CRISPR system Cms protein Csm5 n=1 Tax=uncultured Sulfurovum sp. TaxID=269237 RepID=A0A6S6UCY7_9BACT|nr:MAG: Putative CRISPR-associated RAMP protein, Csm5 family [uncultured Sulfurovum sp.]